MGSKARPRLSVKHVDELRAGYLTPQGHIYLLINAGGEYHTLTYCSSHHNGWLDMDVVSRTIQVAGTEVLHGEYGAVFDIAVGLRDGQVLLIKDGVVTTEHIREREAKRKRELWRGEIRTLRQVGNRLFAVGECGQIYYRPIDGGWKRQAPPEIRGKVQAFLEVAVFGGQLFVGGFETLDENALRPLEETLDAFAYFTKRDEKRASLWRLASDWEKVPIKSDAKACVAMQEFSSGLLVWLSSGERVWHSGEAQAASAQLDELWPCRVVLAGSKLLLWSASGFHHVHDNGMIETLHMPGEKMRLLGVSRQGIVATSQFASQAVTSSEGAVALLEEGKAQWRRLELRRPPPSRIVVEPSFHESYLEFRRIYTQLYGTKPNADPGELVAWDGVSLEGAPKKTPGVDVSVYWFHELASLYGPHASEAAARDLEIWGEDLWAIGWPIGLCYDGSHVIQSIEGDIYHVFGDEWIGEEAREALTSLSIKEFFKRWGHHHIADDFRQFYRVLCEQRGAVGS